MRHGPHRGDDPEWFVLPPSTEVAYADKGAGIAVLSPRADGTLDEVAVVKTMGKDSRAYEAVLASSCLVATWRSGTTGGLTSYRVAPGTGLLTEAQTLTGFVPGHIASGSGGWVGLVSSGTLLVYRVSPSCELTVVGSTATAAPTGNRYEGTLAFDPSGRFLYVDEVGGLRRYAIADGGQVVAQQVMEGLRGIVVVVPPPPS